MSNNIKALLVLEPRDPKPDSLITIIESGEFDTLSLLHSNYRKLYESVDEVLNIYLRSDFQHPDRDLRWILAYDPLRYEHLQEALKKGFLRAEDPDQLDPISLGLY